MTDISHAPGTDDPRSVVPTVLELLESGLGRLHTGAQFYASWNGRPIADFGWGESRLGIAMTSETIVPWLSAGKPLTAAAVLQLWERSRLSLEAPVAEVIPEFASGGKEGVTLRHILTHTAGFPNADAGWPEATWEESIRRLCQTPLPAGTIPGERSAYHFTSSWFLLGEILSRLLGEPFPEVFRRHLCEPLGLIDTWCGMPEGVWRANENRIGGLLHRDKSGLVLSAWHTEPWCTAASPGGNCRGPVRDLGRFYESLLQLGSVPPVLRPATVGTMASRQRTGQFDETLQHTVDFGLGVIVDSNRYGVDTVPYGFGRYCSDRTFGHGGSQCSMGFADPVDRLVVVWATNGRPGESQHQRRNRALNEAVYRDLGLA